MSGLRGVKGHATIKDVAERVGVTHSTVSRVIHGSSRISLATARRVRKAIRDLGYHPNFIARGLATKRTGVIAVIVPELNPFVQLLLRGISDACRRHGSVLMVSSTEYATDEEEAYISVMMNWRVDGILIYSILPKPSPTPSEMRLLRRGAPFVFINRYLREESVDSVGVDNFTAVRRAVDHLVTLRHSRIGMLNGSILSLDAAERHSGFRMALEAHGLGFDPSICGDANFAADDAFTEMRRILRAPRPPTAMFCANDLMAIGACRAAEVEGLRVPDDLSLVGFDNIEAGLYHRPAITTLHPPLAFIGRRAFDLLITRIQDPKGRPQQIICEAELILRDSTGPCRTRANARPATRQRRSLGKSSHSSELQVRRATETPPHPERLRSKAELACPPDRNRPITTADVGRDTGVTHPPSVFSCATNTPPSA
jgi:DNA-binding LacI/PurR family transcriptional regulator